MYLNTERVQYFTGSRYTETDYRIVDAVDSYDDVCIRL